VKLKVEKGVLQIDLGELVEMLGNKERRELAKTLCADEQLFKAVLECVGDDSKYAGHYFSDDEDGPWWFSHRTVLEMREKLIPMMPEVSRLAVEEALRQRDDAQIKERLTDRWAWRLFQAWPDSHWRLGLNLATFVFQLFSWGLTIRSVPVLRSCLRR
jgi:hypothetical protein